MTIFFNGCSMVYGKDLVQQTIAQENNPEHSSHYERNKLAWPGVLATRLGAGYRNEAQCGASMDCIHRTTYTKLSPTLDTHAIIGLTEPLRFEFVDPETGGYEQVVLPRGSYLKMYPGAMRRYIEDTAWYQFTDRACLTSYALNLLSLQSFFKSLGIPYFLVNSMADYVTPCLEALPWFSAKFDKSCWDSTTSMFELCRSEGVPFGSTVHPLEEGHRLFANHVADMLEVKWKL